MLMVRERNPPKLIPITAAIWVNITAIKQSTTKFSAVHQIRRKTGHNCGAKLMSSTQKKCFDKQNPPRWTTTTTKKHHNHNHNNQQQKPQQPQQQQQQKPQQQQQQHHHHHQQQQQQQQQDQELIFEAKMRGEHTYVQSTIQGVSPVWAPPVTWPGFLVGFPIRPFPEWVCVLMSDLFGTKHPQKLCSI